MALPYIYYSNTTANFKYRYYTLGSKWDDLRHKTWPKPSWHTQSLRTVTAKFVVECILRAKTHPLHLTRGGRWRGPKRYQGATIAIASVVAKLKILEIYPNDRHAGSRLCLLPWQKTWNGKCRYVYTPMLSGLRWPGQTVMGSWPPANCNEKIYGQTDKPGNQTG